MSFLAASPGAVARRVIGLLVLACLNCQVRAQVTGILANYTPWDAYTPFATTVAGVRSQCSGGAPVFPVVETTIAAAHQVRSLEAWLQTVHTNPEQLRYLLCRP